MSFYTISHNAGTFVPNYTTLHLTRYKSFENKISHGSVYRNGSAVVGW